MTSLNTLEFCPIRAQYILDILNISTPGERKWIKSDKYPSGYDYTLSTKSTFPWYVKFAYEKRPKNWYTLTEEEKNNSRIYFQYNTNNIKNMLNKIIKNKKPLTELQYKCAKILFENFKIEEEDYYQQYNEQLIDELEGCPF